MLQSCILATSLDIASFSTLHLTGSIFAFSFRFAELMISKLPSFRESIKYAAKEDLMVINNVISYMFLKSRTTTKLKMLQRIFLLFIYLNLFQLFLENVRAKSEKLGEIAMKQVIPSL